MLLTDARPSDVLALALLPLFGPLTVRKARAVREKDDEVDDMEAMFRTLARRQTTGEAGYGGA
ncbi:MAG: hypothetical protein K2R98_04075 [Gemmataceae bacterium]|nr:hypothetical protein [Gemmataceae bacterium]